MIARLGLKWGTGKHLQKGAENFVNISAKLQAPFDASEIEWRVGSTTQDKSKGLALAYVTNRAIQNRLDDTFGPFGWQNEFRPWGDKSQLCGISIKDIGTGDWITKWDGAENTDYEPTKGGLSDSMKRAAYQWGIGRYLYKLDAVWVPIKQQGKSYVIEKGKEPRLPAWALPAGSRQQSKPAQAADKPAQKISKAQQKELIDLAVEYFGAENANERFTEETGYKHPAHVPPEQFEEVKQAIKASLPF
jgi:hypothetical protein